MQPTTEVNPHGIRAGVNLISIALHCICVGCEVVNNATGQHGLEVPSANFLYPHRWKLLLHKIRTKVQCGDLVPILQGITMYSFNMRCMFIIAHGHIPQHIL